MKGTLIHIWQCWAIKLAEWVIGEAAKLRRVCTDAFSRKVLLLFAIQLNFFRAWQKKKKKNRENQKVTKYG